MNHLQEGMVISRFGETYSFAKKIGMNYQFESIKNGEILTFDESAFFSEWRSQTLQILDVKESDREIAMNYKKENSEGSEKIITDLIDLVDKETLEKALNLEQYIKRLKRNGVTRGQKFIIEDEIPRIAKEIDDDDPPKMSTLLKWWRRYEKNNECITSLIDTRKLVKKRIRISKDHELFIDTILDEHYMKYEPKSVSDMYTVYENTINEFNLTKQLKGISPEPLISERSFYRRVASLNKYDVAVAQFGRKEANRQFRFIKGHLPSDYPLEYVEIDHTLLNLFVIDDKLFIPLGRPWITILKDRYSGVILGLFVTFNATGTDSIFGALRHSLFPHDKAHDIWTEIETIMPWGQATTYVTDRGKDFIGTRYKMAIRQIGSDYEYNAVKTPWWKASVERTFLSLEYLLETLPGKTFSNLEKRKDYDPMKHAVVRFSSFIFILYMWACDIHNVSPCRTKSARPIDLWNDGLKSVPRSIPSIPDEIDTLFGKPHSSTLRHDGIRYQYLTYANHPRLEEIFRQYGSGLKIFYRINTSDLGYIMVLDPRDNTYFRVQCLNQEYAAGLSLIQHRHITQYSRIEMKEHKVSENLYRAKKVIANQIGEELYAKNTAAKKKYARYAGIDSDTVLNGNPATLLNISENNSTNAEETMPVNNHNNIPEFDWLVL